MLQLQHPRDGAQLTLVLGVRGGGEGGPHPRPGGRQLAWCSVSKK